MPDAPQDSEAPRADASKPPIGAVAIGRNEGERLRRCLQSLVDQGLAAVYVDSGSTDGSRDVAAGLGVSVVELDTSIGFTAARARNAGFERVRELHPDAGYVLFLDGDCELHPGFVAEAASWLDQHEKLAAVCGRRRERAPEASIYNRMMDLEWDTPIGEAAACGGDALVRVAAFEAVGGFNPSVPAGEEPEMCTRLRAAGWTIQRIDAEMTLHDADLHRFGAWWKRQVRTGYGAQDVETRFRIGIFDSMLNRAAFWGRTIPLTMVGGGIGGMLAAARIADWSIAVSVGLAMALVIAMLYPLQLARLTLQARRQGLAGLDGLAYAWFMLLANFGIVRGIYRATFERLRGKKAGLIEYKSAQKPADAPAQQESGS